jgi:hypothetical protein
VGGVGGRGRARSVGRGGGPALRHPASVLGPARAIGPKGVEAVVQIDVIAAKATFGKNGGDVGCERLLMIRGGLD